MLKDAIAYPGFSAKDIGAEKAFYADTLGVAVSEENGMLTLELAGGQRVLIYPKDDHEPATYTVLNFEVGDIDAAVDELAARGVSFLRYDGLPQDERGVMREWGPPIAWFADPAGNVVAVIEEGSAS
jgi:catechol 2,3-dioxygenase-like lactoylglutathione lyase family enzyme